MSTMMRTRTALYSLGVGLLATPLFAAPTVHMQAPALGGSRAVEPQTQAAVVQDYLESWAAMRAAMAQDRPELLDPDFVGTAREKLGATVVQQAAAGVTTRYVDESHDLQIVFYSPQGSSLEMLDTVTGEQQLLVNGKLLATKPVTSRFLVVMTPSNRWQVRVLQAEPAQ